jgi:hypothetical protein
VAPASRHRGPRLTAQPPTAFSGRTRGPLAEIVGGILVGSGILLLLYGLWMELIQLP